MAEHWAGGDAHIVGQNIRRVRQQRGLKLSTLAFEAGYSSVGTLGNIEAGHTLPSLPKLLAIAQALSVPVEVLLSRDTPLSALHAELLARIPAMPLALVVVQVLLNRVLTHPLEPLTPVLDELLRSVRRLETEPPTPALMQQNGRRAGAS